MICPSKICRQEIPDDSSYCDQCGIKIFHCSKCNNMGINKFCGKCGGEMVFKGVQQPPSVPPQPVKPAPAATVIIPLVTHKLIFCHSEGWNIELADGDILGRVNGNHTDRLSANFYISSTHARISYEHNEDFYLIGTEKSGIGIDDTGSTFVSEINNPCLFLVADGIMGGHSAGDIKLLIQRAGIEIIRNIRILFCLYWGYRCFCQKPIRTSLICVIKFSTDSGISPLDSRYILTVSGEYIFGNLNASFVKSFPRNCRDASKLVSP
jgi:hypothetical protein